MVGLGVFSFDAPAAVRAFWELCCSVIRTTHITFTLLGAPDDSIFNAPLLCLLHLPFDERF